MASLALLFHLVDCAANGARGEIGEVAVLRAAAWCDYLEAHAKRCYGLLMDGGLRSAQALAEKIGKGNLEDGFTARDVRRNQWRYLTTADAVEAALDWLEETDWVRAQEPETGAGRRTKRFAINPNIRRQPVKEAA